MSNENNEQVYIRLSFDKGKGLWEAQTYVFDGTKLDYRGLEIKERLMRENVDIITQLTPSGFDKTNKQYGFVSGVLWIREHSTKPLPTDLYTQYDTHLSRRKKSVNRSKKR